MIISRLPRLIPDGKASKRGFDRIGGNRTSDRITIEISAPKSRDKLWPSSYIWIRVSADAFFLSLSLSLSRHQSEINSIEHTAQRKRGRGNSIKRRHFSPLTYFSRSYTFSTSKHANIYVHPISIGSIWSGRWAEGTKFRVTINIGMEVRSTSMFHQI